MAKNKIPAAPATVPAPVPASVRDLISYQLVRATFHATKPAYAAYGREFGITGIEWRLLGQLQMDGPSSLAALSEQTDMQLAQASRTIASLIERGWVRKDVDERDNRGVRLSLTRSGLSLYRKVFARAAERHARLLAPLSVAGQHALFDALEKIVSQGRAMADEDKAAR